jgi:hypothetical protein
MIKVWYILYYTPVGPHVISSILSAGLARPTLRRQGVTAVEYLMAERDSSLSGGVRGQRGVDCSIFAA